VRITVESHECVVLARAEGELRRSDLERLTNAIDERIAARDRFIVLADALAVTGIEAAARQHVGEHRKRHTGVVEKYDLGLVIALRSPIVRGAITAISWFSGSFDNLKSVESPSEVVRVGRQVLSDAEVTLSPATQEAIEAFGARRTR
jgi:hypothetical protein